MIKLILLAIWYGGVEAVMYERGFKSGKKVIFGKFAIYHLCLFIGSVILVWPVVKLLPLLWFVEDVSFYLFSQKKLNETSWINLWWSGFKVFGQWVPLTYVILLVTYILLELIF